MGRAKKLTVPPAAVVRRGEITGVYVLDDKGAPRLRQIRLGEAVASTLLRHRVQPAGFQLAGLPDAFLDAGALPTLHDRYGISAEKVTSSIKAWLA